MMNYEVSYKFSTDKGGPPGLYNEPKHIFLTNYQVIQWSDMSRLGVGWV